VSNVVAYPSGGLNSVPLLVCDELPNTLAYSSYLANTWLNY